MYDILKKYQINVRSVHSTLYINLVTLYDNELHI